MAGFQLVWALGGTWALEEASGGSLESTTGTRIASGVIALVLLGAALLVLGALVNFLGSTNWERFVFAPPALVLGVLAVVVARSPAPPGPTHARRTPSATAHA